MGHAHFSGLTNRRTIPTEKILKTGPGHRVIDDAAKQ